MLVQWGLHPLDVNENPFRIRNIWLDPSNRFNLLLITSSITERADFDAQQHYGAGHSCVINDTPTLMKAFITTLLAFIAVLAYGDITEDQFNQLKSKQLAAINQLNGKYAEQLALLLDKAKANKDAEMITRIRQEMCDIGYPSKDDWILGEWTVKDNDGATRTYVFKANGSAVYTRRNGQPSTGVPAGSFIPQEDGSYRATLGPVLLDIRQTPPNGVAITRWNIADYPDKSKALFGTAKR